MSKKAKASPRLKTSHLGKYWWITGDEDGPWGPYMSKRECDLARKAVTRSMKNDDVPGYVTGKNIPLRRL